jgi:FtsP/CotA-like multicopper oxidase with cupredoxin domain
VALAPSVRAFVVVAISAVTLSAARSADIPLVQANDNRAPAGVLSKDTLKLSLVVSMARWYPEAPDGPHVDVAAFSEEGKAPSIPAPLIRVPEGTMIAATVRNTFTDSTLYLRGFVKHPSAKFDSVAIKPGETQTFTFPAGAAGTYLYYATLGKVDYNQREREQLAGAFVVDPPGATVNDRILMINIWGEPVDTTAYDNAVAINGKSWPYTERIHTNVGDTLHWRVVNGSVRPHPMHLHGFYFRIDSRGHFAADSAFPVDKRHLEVTEEMRPGSTMAITWSPDRPGNWLFHCHFVFHVNEEARLGYRAAKADMHDMMHEADPMKHMAGLVIGINVSDSAHAYRSPFGSSTPKLRLYADEKRTGSGYAMSYVLQRGDRAPAIDSVEKAGQPLILTQHRPVQITVVNRTHASTSIHWHGIELESFSDGVAGWSGATANTAPMIAPRDSFVARLLLPRSGTFIYHTHLNDVEQITSGAYGPIIVLQPGQKFDPETDHVFTLGWHGTKPTVYLNGDSVPPPVRMRYGKLQRLRFVNIGAAGAFVFTLKQDSTTVTWRPAAKDGAALPADEQVIGPAVRRLTTGETFDAEWMPKKRGTYAIAIRPGGAKNSSLPLVTQRIIVH